MASVAMTNEPIISSDECIRHMYKVLVLGNGTPSMMIRMDRVERILTIIAAIVVPVMIALILALLGFFWGVASGSITITTV